MLCYVQENVRLCWTNSINLSLDDIWVSVSSVNVLFRRGFPSNFLLQPFSDGVLNLCNVGSLLLVLHEMWLQRLFLWLVGLPN